DGFLYRLIAGLPAFFQNSVVDQLITGLTLLLTCGEAGLGVATRLRATAVGGTTAVRCRRILDGPEQADHRSQQRRSQAHPHDNRLLIDTMLCGIPGEKFCRRGALQPGCRTEGNALPAASPTVPNERVGSLHAVRPPTRTAFLSSVIGSPFCL